MQNFQVTEMIEREEAQYKSIPRSQHTSIVFTVCVVIYRVKFFLCETYFADARVKFIFLCCGSYLSKSVLTEMFFFVCPSPAFFHRFSRHVITNNTFGLLSLLFFVPEILIIGPCKRPLE